ncbi:hypothetical protein FACS189452_03090 [Bacteroidia bacterium]|nr:hypothetical protein FACS189452_03090 [Bacteroidia bacterium]
MFNVLFRDLFQNSDFVEERREGKDRILIHSKIGKIVYRRNRRNRNIRISLHSNRSVLVTFPTYCSYAAADQWVCEKMDWIIHQQAKLDAKQCQQKVYSKDEIEGLRQQAKLLLPQRVAQLAAQYEFTYSAISIKNMRTRWGSCSSFNRLNFSIYLITLPNELIDYVILHELCHTIHKNHGLQFWNLLDKVTQGQAKPLAKQMRKYSM